MWKSIYSTQWLIKVLCFFFLSILLFNPNTTSNLLFISIKSQSRKLFLERFLWPEKVKTSIKVFSNNKNTKLVKLCHSLSTTSIVVQKKKHNIYLDTMLRFNFKITQEVCLLSVTLNTTKTIMSPSPWVLYQYNVN